MLHYHKIKHILMQQVKIIKVNEVSELQNSRDNYFKPAIWKNYVKFMSINNWC